PYTLIIHTAEPYPLLANDLSTFGIISAETAGVGEVTFGKDGCQGVDEYPATEAFNSGELAVGTGPYKFVEYVKSDRIVLELNENY
ncbi:ABC transporter substrate-binding protein, partial [Klebsiella pneumoniae]